MLKRKGSKQESKSLLSQINHIVAKYKDKYYKCEILEQNHRQSKVLFID